MSVQEELRIADEELEAFRQLLRESPVENLAGRFQHFAQQNLLETEKQFGFVRQIARHGFTVIGIRELGLIYTVGLWYSYSFPELMLVGPSDEATRAKMNGALQDAADQLWQEEAVEGHVWRRDPRSFLEPRAHRLGQLLFQALRQHGLQTDTLHNADADFLKSYPYGYGFHFYQKFADERDVPILRAML